LTLGPLVGASARRDARPCGKLRGGELLTELDAFYTEHRDCGALEAGVDWPVVWIACGCGATIAQRADEGD